MMHGDDRRKISKKLDKIVKDVVKGVKTGVTQVILLEYLNGPRNL